MRRTSHSLLQTQFPTPLDEIERQLLSTGFWEGALVHTTRDGQRVDVSSFWATHPKWRISDAAVLEIKRVELNRRPAVADPASARLRRIGIVLHTLQRLTRPSPARRTR